MIKKNLKKANSAPKAKLTLFQKWILAFGLFVLIFATFPAVLIILIGLLPSLTILITDAQNTPKLTIVGCFNLTGVFICMNNILQQVNSLSGFSLADNVFNLIVMLGLAAFGVVLYYELPNFFITIAKMSAQKRLNVINQRLDKLALDWGQESIEKASGNSGK